MAKREQDDALGNPPKQNVHDFEAKVVDGAARKAANKQIGDTAIRAPKTKSDAHDDPQ